MSESLIPVYDLFDKSQWKIDDDQWMSERKLLWKKVKVSLENMESMRPLANEMKWRKEFFLNGSYKEYNDLLLCMWFYPGDLNKLLPDIWKYACSIELERARREFFSNAMHGEYPTDYGMMGGREKVISRFFFPKKYSEEEIKRKCLRSHARGIIDEEIYSMRQWPADMFLDYAYIHLSGLLSTRRKKNINKGKSNPYNPFQYLIDYWLSCTHFLGDNITEALQLHIKWMFQQVHKFKLPNEIDIQALNGQRYVEKMTSRIENGEASEVVTKIWEEVKTEINKI